jgi:hypothetical protein
MPVAARPKAMRPSPQTDEGRKKDLARRAKVSLATRRLPGWPGDERPEMTTIPRRRDAAPPSYSPLEGALLERWTLLGIGRRPASIPLRSPMRIIRVSLYVACSPIEPISKRHFTSAARPRRIGASPREAAREPRRFPQRGVARGAAACARGAAVNSGALPRPYRRPRRASVRRRRRGERDLAGHGGSRPFVLPGGRPLTQTEARAKWSC